MFKAVCKSSKLTVIHSLERDVPGVIYQSRGDLVSTDCTLKGAVYCIIIGLFTDVIFISVQTKFLDRNSLNCDIQKKRGIVLLSIPQSEALAIAYHS